MLLSRNWSVSEQFESFRGCERVKRDIPIVAGYRFDQPLQPPANADQSRAAFLQASERPVVMPLAAAQPRAFAIHRDQRHEDEVGLNHRRAALGLHDPERPRIEWVAGAESERLGR